MRRSKAQEKRQRERVRWFKAHNLTEREAAALVGVSHLTLWRRRKAGTAPPFQQTRRGPRYNLHQVLQWAETNGEGINV